MQLDGFLVLRLHKYFICAPSFMNKQKDFFLKQILYSSLTMGSVTRNSMRQVLFELLDSQNLRTLFIKSKDRWQSVAGRMSIELEQPSKEEKIPPIISDFLDKEDSAWRIKRRWISFKFTIIDVILSRRNPVVCQLIRIYCVTFFFLQRASSIVHHRCLGGKDGKCQFRNVYMAQCNSVVFTVVFG